MDVVRDRIRDRRDAFGRQLGARPGDRHKFGAVRIEFGRAAFVILDMRVAVAQHSAERRAQGGEGERIGGGSGRHPQDGDLAPEQFGQARIERAAQRIAVIGGVDPVRCLHRGEDRRMDRGRIVREKAHVRA